VHGRTTACKRVQRIFCEGWKWREYVQWTECGAKTATAAALLLLQHVLSCTVPLLLLVLSQHVLFQAASLLLLGCDVCHVSYILLLLLLWTVVVLLLLVLLLRLR
jgi:hypothetical protein